MTPWWRDAVLYEVYVRSFADADGDGVGDLAGIRRRLAYLRDLGVDGIWITPFYPSPMVDHGYDVADLRDVDPLFGDLAAFDALVGEARRLGLAVLVDLVPNHSSDRHRWFRAALAAGPGSPERERYLFRDGRGPGGALPPNDWQSVFGGPAWARVPDGQWYLHLFAAEQPDWNWRHPDVWDEYDRTIRFWLDRGVDGFRIDVAHGLFKDEHLRDHPEGGALEAGVAFRSVEEPHIWDQDEVHDVYRHWRAILDGYEARDGRPRVFVAEAWVGADRLVRYVRPGELHLAFAFSLLQAEWSATAWREAIEANLASVGQVGAPATWVLGNHDVVRPVSRYGGGAAGTRRARAAALALLALPGAVFLYQGDELGLPEVEVAPPDRRDPVWERSGRTVAGRDGCRVPMPWSGTAPPYGFSPDGVRPWLPQPAGWADRTVEAQAADPLSTLVLHRGALAVRRAMPALGDGRMRWREAPAGCLVLDRPGSPTVTCAVNTGKEEVALDLPGRLVLASEPVRYDGRTLVLPADTTVWLAGDAPAPDGTAPPSRTMGT